MRITGMKVVKHKNRNTLIRVSGEEDLIISTCVKMKINFNHVKMIYKYVTWGNLFDICILVIFFSKFKGTVTQIIY